MRRIGTIFVILLVASCGTSHEGVDTGGAEVGASAGDGLGSDAVDGAGTDSIFEITSLPDALAGDGMGLELTSGDGTTPLDGTVSDTASSEITSDMGSLEDTTGSDVGGGGGDGAGGSGDGASWSEVAQADGCGGDGLDTLVDGCASADTGDQLDSAAPADGANTGDDATTTDSSDGTQTDSGGGGGTDGSAGDTTTTGDAADSMDSDVSDATGTTDTAGGDDASSSSDVLTGADGGLTDAAWPYDGFVIPDLDEPGDADTSDGETTEGSDGGGLCGSFLPYCDGLEHVTCDPTTGLAAVTPCTSDLACFAAGCSDTVGCTLSPADGSSCDDGDPCTQGDLCLAGYCIGSTATACDDGDPCTEDTCTPEDGCVSTVVDGLPCDDGDPCTAVDSCTGGLCQGLPLACGGGGTCEDGVCTCPEPCGSAECGEDTCGNSCGVCEGWEDCQTGTCEAVYPEPPYGSFLGDTIPNHVLVEPESLEEVPLASYYGTGKLILVAFSAGWCIVCKNDTVTLNQWNALYGPDGLSIIEIIYEDGYQDAITQSYALAWKSAFGIEYDFYMDTSYDGANGTADGGMLDTLTQPEGPVNDGYFPVVLLICPETMEILYITSGFYDEVLQPLVEDYLYTTDCGP